MNDQALIIFYKNPTLGRVKTRLAATIGNQEALSAFLHLADHTRAACDELADIEKYVFYSDQVPAEPNTWPENNYQKRLQIGTDLGQRMKQAFAELREIGHTHIAIIGTDCPYITPELLQTAFKILKKHDAIIGPSTDGGYYLLGLRCAAPELFDDIAWSTSQVLPQTLMRIFDLEMSNALLPTLTDIDEAAEWQAYLSLSSTLAR